MENKKIVLKGVIQSFERENKNPPLYRSGGFIPQGYINVNINMMEAFSMRESISNMIKDIYRKHCGVKEVMDLDFKKGTVKRRYEKI